MRTKLRSMVRKNGADRIGVEGDFPNGVTVSGPAAVVEVIGALGATDGLSINGLAGADAVDASALQAGAINLSIDGGDGNDVITGSQGNDLINGGAGTDTINAIGSAAIGSTTIAGSSGDDALNVKTEGTGPSNVQFAGSQRIGALTIASGGFAALAAGGVNVLTVTSLNITGTGRLDLKNNGLIVDYSSSGQSPIGGINSLLASGFHSGAWNGNGIMTSFGNANTFALGVGEASDVASGGIFAGQIVDRSTVVAKFTLYGDATLDGTVGFDDLVRLAQNFGRAGKNFSSGDFDYDGTVGFSDLVKSAQNYNTSLPPAANFREKALNVRMLVASDPPRVVQSNKTHDLQRTAVGKW